MKKITTILFLAVLIFAAKPSETFAQMGNTSAGAGIVYGADLEEIGFQLGGTYSINPNFRVGADFIYWLIDDEEFLGLIITTTAWELNGNVHYIFYEKRDLILYGLATAGLHYAGVDVENPGVDSASDSESEIAIGIGGGLEYNLGGLKLYAEPRLFLSGLDQFAVSAGVRIPI